MSVLTQKCDTCGSERDPANLAPWAHGGHRCICEKCFEKEYGITIEERSKQEDDEFFTALDNAAVPSCILPGETFWMGEPKYAAVLREIKQPHSRHRTPCFLSQALQVSILFFTSSGPSL